MSGFRGRELGSRDPLGMNVRDAAPGPPSVDYRSDPSFGGDFTQGHEDRDHPYPAPWTPVSPPSDIGPTEDYPLGLSRNDVTP